MKTLVIGEMTVLIQGGNTVADEYLHDMSRAVRGDHGSQWAYRIPMHKFNMQPVDYKIQINNKTRRVEGNWFSGN
jgi:hypothetical protein